MRFLTITLILLAAGIAVLFGVLDGDRDGVAPDVPVVADSAPVGAPPADPPGTVSPIRRETSGEGESLLLTGLLSANRNRPLDRDVPRRSVDLQARSRIDGSDVTAGVGFSVTTPSSGLPGGMVLSFDPGRRGPLQLTLGSTKFSAHLEGTELGSTTVDIPAGHDAFVVPVEVDAIGPIQPLVVDATGTPVAGASILLRTTDAQGSRERAWSEATDGSGRGSIPALRFTKGMTIDLVATHPGFEAGDAVRIADASGAILRQPIVRLGTTVGQLVGRVRDETHATERDLIVVARSLDEPATEHRAHTKPDGTFRVYGVQLGRYALTVERRCLVPEPTRVVVVPSADAVVPVGDLVATRGTIPLSVRVVEGDGTPIETGEVQVEGVTVGSLKGEGRCTVHVCHPDPHRVTIQVRRGGNTLLVEAGDLDPDYGEHVIVVRPRGLRLLLRDEDGSPIERITLTFVARQGERTIEGKRMLLGGRCSIEEAGMSGTWEVDLNLAGFIPTTTSITIDDKEGASATQDLRMQRNR
ncbi:MAG: carboxypeptidase regulatory-like domain-containing protein [Planctomycetes bacterium]|nr:carboxypeptidase regulatory-like domain-containing protein [Planctomycetota bacterium]